MTEGPIGSTIVKFCIPMILGQLFQQLYNTTDALIVGRMLGARALASVSATGNLVGLLVSFFAGIASGASIITSRFYGAKDQVNLEKAIHTNITMGIVTSFFLTAVGLLFTPSILRMMHTPDDIIADSILYLRIFFGGIIGLVMYNTCMGIMRALGDSKHPLYYLIFSSLLNVFLDIAFIGQLHMGVDGAAYATILAQLLSACLAMGRMLRTTDVYNVQLSKLGMDFGLLKMIFTYGVPAGFQSCAVSLSNVFIQSSVNTFGSMAVAGFGAASKIEQFALIPISTLPQATATFVGQNLGAGEKERARKGSRFTLTLGASISLLMGACLYFFAPQLLGFYTTEEAAIASGALRIHICAPFFFLTSITHNCTSVLRGSGRSTIPMLVTLSTWCLFRVLICKLVVPIIGRIEVVFWAYPITWMMSASILMFYYLKVDWTIPKEDLKKTA